MKFLSKLSASFLLLTSMNAFSDYSCTVNVDRVLVYNDGSVNVFHNGRNDFTYICNTKGTWKGIDTVTCAMWVSMLQNIQNEQYLESKNERKAIFYYAGSGSCGELPTYSAAPAPRYVGSVFRKK